MGAKVGAALVLALLLSGCAPWGSGPSAAGGGGAPAVEAGPIPLRPSDIGPPNVVVAGVGTIPLSPYSGEGVHFEGPPGLSAAVLDLGPAPYEVVASFSTEAGVVTVPALRWPGDFPADSNEGPRLPVTG